MKLKYWPRYLARHVLCYCRDVVAPSYPVERIEADFFVSMGGYCRTATQLRRHNLRICASPLDWMQDYTLADAATLFETGFSTFFVDIRELPDKHGIGRTVEDTKNGMISIHHFPLSMSLEDGQKFFRERAMRHFTNTHRYMTEAERIAIVTNRTENVDDICRFITRIRTLYSAEIIHINIRSGIEKKREKITLENGSLLYDYTFDDTIALNEQIATRGNDYEWKRILGKFRRTKKFSPPEKLWKDFIEYNASSNGHHTPKVNHD